MIAFFLYYLVFYFFFIYFMDSRCRQLLTDITPTNCIYATRLILKAYFYQVSRRQTQANQQQSTPLGRMWYYFSTLLPVSITALFKFKKFTPQNTTFQTKLLTKSAPWLKIPELYFFFLPQFLKSWLIAHFNFQTWTRSTFQSNICIISCQQLLQISVHEFNFTRS